MKNNKYVMDGLHWRVENIEDPELFFKSISILSDEELILCLSDGAWSEQTLNILEQLTLRTIAYPVDLNEFRKCYFIPVNDKNTSLLYDLSLTSAAPEIASHIAVISNSDRILEWFDMPGDPISISSAVSKEKVNLFAQKCLGIFTGELVSE